MSGDPNGWGRDRVPVSGTFPDDEPELARREAAVLVPLYRTPNGVLRLVLIKREEGGVHGGQLAFPGGKRDPDDSSFLAAALRETREETGLSPDCVDVLEELPAVDTLTTNFRVFPFLGRIRPPAIWTPAKGEVSGIVEVDLERLARSENHGTRIEQFPSWTRPLEVPFFRVGRERLWGLTYRILQPLVPRLLDGDWEI